MQIIGTLILLTSIVAGCSESPSKSVSTANTNSKTDTQTGQSTVTWTSLQTQVSQMQSLGVDADKKMEQSKQFVKTAFNELQAGQTQAEINDLTQAKALADQSVQNTVSEITILDTIMNLKLSPIMMQYFQTKKRAGTALLSAEQIDQNAVNILLADPTMSKPENVQFLNSVNSKVAELTANVQQAEDEASKIATQHPDEFPGAS